MSTPATEGRRGVAAVKLPWVVHDAVEEDWYCFATEAEAVTKAQQIIDSYGGDSWPGAIDEITVMQVTHAPVRTVLFEREGMTDDEWYAATGDDGDHDTWVTYDMRPVVSPSDGTVQAERCSGIAAIWCPNHGDCRCPDVVDDRCGGLERPFMDDPNCPLHSATSTHAESAGTVQPDPRPDGYPPRPAAWLRVGQLREAIGALPNDAPVEIWFPCPEDEAAGSGPDCLPARWAHAQASDASGVFGTDPMAESTLGVLEIGCTSSPAVNDYPDHDLDPPALGSSNAAAQEDTE